MSLAPITHRFSVEPGWPNGGMVSRPVGDRRYDVQDHTGNAVSTVPQGQWARGQVIRQGVINLRPAKPPVMYDPTDINTWDKIPEYN